MCCFFLWDRAWKVTHDTTVESILVLPRTGCMYTHMPTHKYMHAQTQGGIQFGTTPAAADKDSDKNKQESSSSSTGALVPLDQLFKAKPGEWRCSHCMTMNAATATAKCASVRMPPHIQHHVRMLVKTGFFGEKTHGHALHIMSETTSSHAYTHKTQDTTHITVP